MILCFLIAAKQDAWQGRLSGLVQGLNAASQSHAGTSMWLKSASYRGWMITDEILPGKHTTPVSGGVCRGGEMVNHLC